MEKSNLKSKRNLSIVAILIVIMAAFAFYWLAIKPSNIRKACSTAVISPYTQEEKDKARKNFDEINCSTITDSRKIKCSLWESIFNSPYTEDRQRPATDDEYVGCLREHGISDQQAMTSSQLKSIEQGINDQSTKIDSLRTQAEDLRKDSLSAQQKATSLNNQIIQQQQAQQDYQNDQEYKLKSYQSCVDMWTATDGGYIKPEHKQLCR